MTTPTPRRRYSSIPPFREIHTAAELELERRLQSLRARLGDDAKIELHHVDHQPTCGVHDARRCDCADPVPVVIVDGTDWLRLLADGTAEPAPPPEPHPDWLDCPEEPHLLAEVMPVAEWLRLQCCRTVVSTIGDGAAARFIGGEVIDSQLSRRLARIEGPTPILP